MPVRAAFVASHRNATDEERQFRVGQRGTRTANVRSPTTVRRDRPAPGTSSGEIGMSLPSSAVRPRIHHVLTGLVAVICALAVTGGTAYASARPAPTPTKAASAAGHSVTADKSTSTTKPIAAASSTKRRAAVGKAALAGTNVPDTCSGAIQPDTIYPCSSLPAGATNTYTFDLAQ